MSVCSRGVVTSLQRSDHSTGWYHHTKSVWSRVSNTPIFYIVIYSKIFQLALPSINGKVCDVINISRCLLWNTHPHVWCTCNTYVPLPMNFLAFISSSAVQICEVHILTYHCCNCFVFFVFCFFFFSSVLLFRSLRKWRQVWKRTRLQICLCLARHFFIYHVGVRWKHHKS